MYPYQNPTYPKQQQSQLPPEIAALFAAITGGQPSGPAAVRPQQPSLAMAAAGQGDQPQRGIPHQMAPHQTFHSHPRMTAGDQPQRGIPQPGLSIEQLLGMLHLQQGQGF